MVLFFHLNFVQISQRIIDIYSSSEKSERDKKPATGQRRVLFSYLCDGLCAGGRGACQGRCLSRGIDACESKMCVGGGE